MLEKNLTATNPKVSVCVISYNHELYVEKCLESILSQKCDFEFEIIIRDDFSQDKTAEIIKKFRVKFPIIIKSLDGSSNYGANNNLLTVLNAAKGEYIAVCEGDDYWLDNYKIQKQVNLMDTDSSIKFTAHPCRIHDESGLKKTFFVKDLNLLDINCNDVLSVSGQFAPTASYMFRSEVIKNLPDWFKDAPVGDFFLEMYALAMGHGKYLPDAMSAYRTFSINSWTAKNTGNKASARLNNACSMKKLLEKMRREVIFEKYDFSPKIGSVYFNIAIAYLLAKDFEGFRQSIVECKLSQSHFPAKQNFFYYFRDLPKLLNFLYRFKLIIR